MMISAKWKIFLLYWFPVICYCIFIFTKSSQPSPESIPDLPNIDKALHIGAYALLGALFVRAYMTINSINRNTVFLVIISILSSSLYGLSDEIHQYFVPFRDADPLDFLADTIGSIIGVQFYIKFDLSRLI